MMVDEARVKQMIDIADELIEALADQGFGAAESGVVLALAAIQTAKALGRSKVEIIDSLSAISAASRSWACSELILIKALARPG